MSWLRLSVLAFLITILIFAGVASGQELPEQGPQPLQSDLANPEQPGLDAPKSISKSGSKATNQKAPRAAGIKKSAKGASGASPKPYSFGPAAGQYGMQQDREAQIGASRGGLLNMGNNQSSSPGSTSFLDGYLLRSLHDDSLVREKPRREDEPKDDLPLQGKASSKY
jgi:hypothetical protein